MAYRNYDTAVSHIVDPNGFGDFTTIGSALTAASSGQTIFIRPGTYTENPTLVAGVNLTAFECDSALSSTSNVIIKGNCTLSTAGTVTISGVQLQTNSANCITVSGSVASILNLNNCYINCTNNTGISYSSSSSSSQINIFNCNGNLGTTSIGLFSDSSSGLLYFRNCYFTNSGSSTTASTCSAGQLNTFACTFNNPLTYSSSNTSSSLEHTDIETNSTNSTSITTSGTGTLGVDYCYIASGSASSLSIGTGTTIIAYFTEINSSNTNAVTGLGTFSSNGTIYVNSHLSNVTTQSGGAISGITQGTAPSAGFIGEQFRANNTVNTLSNNTPTNITSINLTAGIWDISLVSLTEFSGVSTAVSVAISTNSASFSGTSAGDNYLPAQFTQTAPYICLSIPSYRVTISSTTTYYLVAQITFSSGGGNVIGRISGTRVG